MDRTLIKNFYLIRELLGYQLLFFFITLGIMYDQMLFIIIGGLSIQAVRVFITNDPMQKAGVPFK
ncbi:hypothetical protein MUN89_12810 [Halobacillus salinarum]|uniref:Uncharacterized protein n=1 Tax=Halobacillus salinarum TaxID=2932257 RepID=A0ABY4EHA0_9BACI|nr:hypothetical protein [Halobacillus salinarum]UOQ42842.1 hypothetical protein MUN89_12810 [Halobacillus salinarum]